MHTSRAVVYTGAEDGDVSDAPPVVHSVGRLPLPRVHLYHGRCVAQHRTSVLRQHTHRDHLWSHARPDDVCGHSHCRYAPHKSSIEQELQNRDTSLRWPRRKCLYTDTPAVPALLLLSLLLLLNSLLPISFLLPLQQQTASSSTAIPRQSSCWQSPTAALTWQGVPSKYCSP